MKKPIIFMLVFSLCLGLFLAGCINDQNGDQKGQPNGEIQENELGEYKDTAASSTKTGNVGSTGNSAVVYKNTQYQFSFPLPESWKKYSVVTEEWVGFGLDSTNEGEVVESGPLISIRHPEWTAQKPRQDIPILIFTLEQWEAVQQEKFHIGAAPILPKELGRNSKYVFALPARYNFAFPTGYEEVEEILESNPLQAL